MKRFTLKITLLLAALLLLAVPCLAQDVRTPLGETQLLCTLENCTHQPDSRCPVYAKPTLSYNGAAAPSGAGFYYNQLESTLAKTAVDAVDAFFNPYKTDVPMPRLGVIEVYGLPARLTEQDLRVIHQQTVDILCIARPQYYWLDKNNLRFGIKSGEHGSVLVMDFSDRILNAYTSLAQAWEEGQAASAAAQAALAPTAGTQGDVARLRAIHNYILEHCEYTYEIEQASSFTGVLVHGRALCEGYAKAFQLLARRAGYECELVAGYGILLDGSRELHMWNAVRVGGEWYAVDATWDDSENLSRGDKYRYFLLSAPELESLGDHILDGNINLKTLEDKATPRPEVKVFGFPRFATAPLSK